MSVEKKNPFTHTNSDSSYWETGVFIGGYVSQEDAEYLRLLAIYHSTSINGILHKVIRQWSNEQEPKESIYQVLADRAHIEWMRRLKQMKYNKDWEAQWESYKSEIRERLSRRHLSEPTIEKVLEYLEEIKGRV